jgi:hypothetical protein
MFLALPGPPKPTQSNKTTGQGASPNRNRRDFSMYTIFTALGIWAVLNLLFFFLARHLDARAGNKECRCTIVSNVPGIAILSLFAAYFAGVMTSLSIGASFPTKTIVASSTELASMSSKDSVSGSFFLGCGHINDSTVYQIYVRNADGSASPDRVWADRSTRIVEDNTLNQKGYLKVIQVVRDQSGPRARWATFDSNRVVATWNEFDVPAGTVVQNFSLQ